jgi:transcription termination/antitermination protein NusA
MDEDTANAVIMTARAHWFEGEGEESGATHAAGETAAPATQEAHHD